MSLKYWATEDFDSNLTTLRIFNTTRCNCRAVKFSSHRFKRVDSIAKFPICKELRLLSLLIFEIFLYHFCPSLQLWFSVSTSLFGEPDICVRLL